MEFLKEKTNDDFLRRKLLGKLSLGSFFKKLFLSLDSLSGTTKPKIIL